LAALALAGCGEDAAESPREDREPVQVAALGDSITAGTPLWDPDPSIRAQIPQPDRRSQYEYWASDAQPSLEFRNCGVPGERTDQIAARLSACARQAKTDALVIGGGTNDIAQGGGIDGAVKNLQAMARKGLDKGLDTYIVEVLPWNVGHPQVDPLIEQLNDEIHRIARAEGIDVIEFHDALENPRKSGTMPAKFTVDGSHPTVDGYRILGELVADELQP
jgi:lysophospholipase L1-like esterase